MRRVCGWSILLLLGPELSAAGGPRTILVFPFENQSGRSDLSWISESFAEILSSRLSVPDRYALGREERNAAYEQLDLPPATPLTLASEYQVAETLGVDWGVIGSFTVEGNRLTVQARILDVRRVKLLPTLEITGELADLVDLQTRLAWRLRAAHDPAFVVGQEEDFRRRFREVHLDAFENYIRGVLAAEPESHIRFLREADRLDPSDGHAAFELGRYFFEQKDYVNSASWLAKISEEDPNYLEALFLRAVDGYFLGHQAAAEKDFMALAKRIPLNEVWNNLGVMQARRGRYGEALTSFERAYQGDPTDLDFSFNLGASLWYLKRYAEAANVLEETASLGPEDLETHMLLGAVLGKLGRAEEQQREIQWLAEREGSAEARADPAQDFLPQARLKKNYDGRAFRLLSLTVGNVLEESPVGEPAIQHGAAHLARGRRFFAEGRLPEAERELVEAVSLLPQDSEPSSALAEVYEAQGRPREAAAQLEKSLKIRDSAEAHVRLARIYLGLDERRAVRQHGAAALGLDPGNREAERLIDAAKADERPAGAGKKP